MEEDKKEEKIQNPEETGKQQIPEIEINEIFKVENISQIDQDDEPIQTVTTLLESHYRKVYKRADFERSKLLAQAEYHVNTLNFLKETFPTFPNEIITKLLNLLSDFISISEEEDLLKLSKEKISYLKFGLYKLKLLPKKKEEIIQSNKEDKTILPDGRFFLNMKEINELISYFKVSVNPFLNIWKSFNLDKKKVQNQNIQIIVNRPIGSLPLVMATMKEEEKQIEQTEEVEKEKEEIEEKKEEEKKEEVKQEEKVEEKPKTYMDILNSLNLNAETKKIIIEKIEELHKDVENKIDGRKKTLEEKLKEIEDTVKGKKK